MKATTQLHELGQSLWLDDITRSLLDRGTLQRYIDDLPITALTSDPAVFDHAITHNADYDHDSKQLHRRGFAGEALFLKLRR